MRILKKYLSIVVVLFIGLSLTGCVTTKGKAFQASESQVQIRSIQTRAFDTTDKELMMRTVISTMQDLEFVIEKADLTLGAVTGTKYLGNAVIAMTVTVRPRGEKQLLVRASAQYGMKQVDDPETYQDFFNALEKAMFLTAHQVD